ncbi:hypothetical protein ARMSODRAFT_838033, partial [Armillaria solidipes]
WLTKCDHLGLEVRVKQKVYKDAIYNFRLQQGKQPPLSCGSALRPYSKDAFIDALISWIVADDQSINVIENPHLHAIFLMLREGLKDSDIPHRSSLRARILQMWDEYMEHLASELKVFLYILDRLHITSKIGWITCDNATNNDTMMDHLELLLSKRYRDMPFERVDNRI